MVVVGEEVEVVGEEVEVVGEEMKEWPVKVHKGRKLRSWVTHSFS